MLLIKQMENRRLQAGLGMQTERSTTIDVYGTQGGLSIFRIGVFPLWILPIKSLRQIRWLSLRWSLLADREMCLYWSREQLTLPKLCGLEVAKTNENQRPGFPYRFSMFSWSFNQRLQACACTLTYILACQMYIYTTVYYWPWAWFQLRP